MKKRNIILISVISITSIAIGIVFLHFVTNRNADASSTFVVGDNPYMAPGFEEDEELDENLKSIKKNKNKSNGASSTLTAYQINKSASAQAESYMLGDVNRDGKISIKDATLIQMMSANFIESTDEMNALADVNADNSVDVFDATLIQKYCAGLIDGFGSSEPSTEPTTESTKPSEDSNNLPPTAPFQSGEWGAPVENQ